LGLDLPLLGWRAMNCLTCGAPIDRSRATCASCGTPIDTDGNGLPDVLGLLLTEILEVIVLDRSLVAAALFCPGRCPGCSGPGRIFTWHEKSTNFEGHVSVQLCTNPRIDVSASSDCSAA
jgi:hypothetical protein